MAKKKRAKRKPVKKAKRTTKRKVVRHKPVKHKAAKRKPIKRKVAKRRPVKRKAAKRKKRSPGRKLVKQVKRRSVERVMAGKKRKRRSPRKRKIVMAGVKRRRRIGSNGGSSKLLIGLAIGAAAIYFLTKKATPAYSTTQLPPLAQTNNYTRNTQSQDLINYAMAGGLAIDAIIKLIDKLNTSSDQEVSNIYDTYHATGGSLELYA
jgi:hypothetical protein